jgi:Xaa-Pro aminopeptidase
MVGSDDRCAALLARLGDTADAFIAASPISVSYLTGFLGVFGDEPAALAVISARQRWVLSDSRFETALRQAAEGTGWDVVMAPAGLVDSASKLLEGAGCRRAALETSITHARWESFSAAMDGRLVEALDWVEDLRTVKSADEISAIEAAQALTDLAFQHLMGHVLRAGVTEREIGLELEFFLRREGSEGVAFAPIVAGGPNSAKPHANPSDRALVSGDFVVLDFGARVDGYCADMTRTVVVGSPSAEQRAIYDVVLAANAAGIGAVEAGRTGAEIDAVARAVIEDAGYGEHFGHGLGHGVGLEVHEQPRVGPRSATPVPLGSVITIEPGIYIAGMGGVRIEDLAVVEGEGARVLTRSTKELLEA